MKGTFQIVSHKNGARTPAFVSDSKELAEKLDKLLEEDKDLSAEDYVLLLAVHGEDEFSTAPLMMINSYLQMHDINFQPEEELAANG